MNVTVVTDDEPTVVVADSLDQAVGALKNQIKMIKQKSPHTEADKKRAEALSHAIEEINKVAKKIKGLDVGSAKDKAKIENKRIVIRKLDLDKAHVIGDHHASAAQNAEADKRLGEAQVRFRVVGKMADAEKDRGVEERQAEVEKALAEVQKARARVNELTQELMKKRKELSRAAGELSHLKNVEARVVTIPNPKSLGIGRASGSISSSRSGSASGSSHGFTIVTPKLSDPDRQRLADLEKKLDKLLEEVASLKKSRAK